MGRDTHWGNTFFAVIGVENNRSIYVNLASVDKLRPKDLARDLKQIDYLSLPHFI